MTGACIVRHPGFWPLRRVGGRLRAGVLLSMVIAAPAVAQGTWGRVPRMDGIPWEFRGIPKHGEVMVAAVACGRRPLNWGTRYREAVDRWVRSRARSTDDAATVMRIVDERAVFAREAVAADRRGYCRFAASLVELRHADQVVAGTDRPW